MGFCLGASIYASTMGYGVKNFPKQAWGTLKACYFCFEKIAILIGVMGGLKGALDIWQTFRPNYDLEIKRSSPVRITYDPKQNDLIFTVGLIVNNRGTTSDAIERSDADLRLITDPSRHCTFSNREISFKDRNNQIPKNLPIQKEAFKSVTCEISAQMTDDLHEMFQQHETRRELLITLIGQGEVSYQVRYFFDLGEDVAPTLFDSSKKEPVTLTFIGSDLQ